MQMPDLINGLFELGGSGAILISVRKLTRDKSVRGISYVHVAFFTLWGAWNVFYYPHLGQTLSFVAGILVLAVNSVYLGLLVHYTRNPGGGQACPQSK